MNINKTFLCCDANIFNEIDVNKLRKLTKDTQGCWERGG